MELEADIGYGDAGQNGQNKIGCEPCKRALRNMCDLLGAGFGCAEVSMIVGRSDLILETFADETNYSLPRRILMALKCEMRHPLYWSVTFNAVARPVFTVALVLTPAKPGAATVTV
jgi:hypothetical protein